MEKKEKNKSPFRQPLLRTTDKTARCFPSISGFWFDKVSSDFSFTAKESHPQTQAIAPLQHAQTWSEHVILAMEQLPELWCILGATLGIVSWYSAKWAGVERACPNKVMAHMWFMHYYSG